jgi:hypothetical protein
MPSTSEPVRRKIDGVMFWGVSEGGTNAMSQRTFSLVAGLIFLVVALAHLTRLVLGWHVALGGWTLPMWISWLALVVAGYLAYEGLSLSRRS